MPEIPAHPADDTYDAVICVYGAGNALNPKKHVTRARLYAAAALEVDPQRPPLVAFFGTCMPSMAEETTFSEAHTLRDLWYQKRAEMDQLPPELTARMAAFNVPPAYLVLHEDAAIVTTQATSKRIAERYLANGKHVYLVMNKAYIGRARNYLRDEARKLGLPWTFGVRKLVHLVPCGGNFWPYVQEEGLIKATIRYIKNPILYEFGARSLYNFPSLRYLKPLIKGIKRRLGK